MKATTLTDDALEDRLLAHVLGPNYRPAKPRILAAMLKIDPDDRTTFRRTLRRLVKRGQLRWGPRHLVMPPEGVARDVSADLDDAGDEAREDTPTPSPRPARQQANREGDDWLDAPSPVHADEDVSDDGSGEDGTSRGGRVSGIFRRARAGYGFVRPDGAKPGDSSGDIFVPASRAGDAVSGDRVLVRLMPHKKDRRSRSGGRDGAASRGDDKAAGRIVEVVERRRTDFVGVYSEDERGRGRVLLTGDSPREPIFVADAGATGAADGDTVVIEMTKFPSPERPGEGVITEILGPRGEPTTETAAVIRQFDLRTKFPDDVVEDAREQARLFAEKSEAGTLADGRRDLTGEVVVTIDPVDARDFDDAISLVAHEDGTSTLGVHIADVAAFVPVGSALDREARLRGTSVYLPGRVIAMLPEIISNHLASLQPDTPRLARTVFLTYDAEGRVVATEITRSVIKSRHRFAYEDVGALLSDAASPSDAADPPRQAELPEGVHDLVMRMAELATKLRARRIAAGSLEMAMPEMKVELDRDGHAVGAKAVQQDFPHQIIEEFMLAANVAVAERLADKEFPFLHRIHPHPDPQKLEELEGFLDDLGVAHGPLRQRESLQKLLHEAPQSPLSLPIQFAVLRAMKKAIYSPLDEGHFALNFRQYCHFTSPIRRYPDLTIHRLLDKVQDRESGHPDYHALERLGQHCSDCETRAESAERELIKIKLLEYMSSRVGETMEVVLTGVESFGLFAQAVELPIEGFLPISTLPTDQWRYDDVGHQLTGRHTGRAFRLGDKLTLVLGAVDRIRRQLEWRFPSDEGPDGPLQERRRQAKLAKAPRRKEKADRSATTWSDEETVDDDGLDDGEGHRSDPTDALPHDPGQASERAPARLGKKSRGPKQGGKKRSDKSSDGKKSKKRS